VKRYDAVLTPERVGGVRIYDAMKVEAMAAERAARAAEGRR
jgi:hypothetical protein